MITNQNITVIQETTPIPYLPMYERQIERRNRVEQDDAPNTLFLLEHTPTITTGRNTQIQHLLLSEAQYAERGIDLVNVDRGGDVTYHGPGQLVAYPILNLNHWKCSVRWYLRSLEEVILRTIAHYDLQGERLDGYTGVWVNGAKIANVGIGVHHWTTFHGIAINVSPNMEHYTWIVPCGIPDKPIVSMAQLMTTPPPPTEIMAIFENEFKLVFENY